jgi:dihydroneopterin aldolase
MLSDDAPLVIEVIGLPVFAHHGVREHEKRDGQRFVIDLRLEPESAAGCETDRLEHTVSYSEAARIAVDAASRRRYDLVERLAAAIGDTLLAQLPLRRVTITVHKPSAPLAQPFADVVIRVIRTSSRGL